MKTSLPPASPDAPDTTSAEHPDPGVRHAGGAAGTTNIGGNAGIDGSLEVRARHGGVDTGAGIVGGVGASDRHAAPADRGLVKRWRTLLAELDRARRRFNETQVSLVSRMEALHNGGG
jgi:hypothetical protein